MFPASRKITSQNHNKQRDDDNQHKTSVVGAVKLDRQNLSGSGLEAEPVLVGVWGHLQWSVGRCDCSAVVFDVRRLVSQFRCRVSFLIGVGAPEMKGSRMLAEVTRLSSAGWARAVFWRRQCRRGSVRKTPMVVGGFAGDSWLPSWWWRLSVGDCMRSGGCTLFFLRFFFFCKAKQAIVLEWCCNLCVW